MIVLTFIPCVLLLMAALAPYFADDSEDGDLGLVFALVAAATMASTGIVLAQAPPEVFALSSGATGVDEPTLMMGTALLLLAAQVCVMLPAWLVSLRADPRQGSLRAGRGAVGRAVLLAAGAGAALAGPTWTLIAHPLTRALQHLDAPALAPWLACIACLAIPTLACLVPCVAVVLCLDWTSRCLSSHRPATPAGSLDPR